MASEAEYERLYQLWESSGGGGVTLANTNTPAAYYDERSSISLSPEQLAALQTRQAHYNKTQALQVFSSEISANNFTNPYNVRSDTSIRAFNSFNSTPSVASVAALSTILGGNAVLIAALSSIMGVDDLGKLLGVAGLGLLGAAMFGKLQSHTNSQTVDLPGTLEQVGSLADMSKQFGTSPDSCSIFNELMGILSGAFDGVMDFIDAGLDKLTSALAPLMNQINAITGAITAQIGALTSVITNLASQGMAAITDAISGLLPNLSSLVPQGLKDAFNEIGNLASGMMGAIADMTNQISNEIANLVDMASAIAQKLAALALAAASFDPCKLMVLMNTGSPDLKSAIGNITSPLTDAIPDIATVLDPRANQADVEAAVQSAKESAPTDPGVPQSPMTPKAQLYTPHDSYLFDVEENFESQFGGEEVYKSTPTETGTKTTELPKSGSTSDKKEEKGVTTHRPSTYESNIYAQWTSEHSNNALQLKRRIGKLRNQARKALKNGKFRNESVKNSVEDMQYEYDEVSAELQKLLSDAKTGLSYVSNIGKRDPALEKEKENEYKSIWGPRANEGIRRITRDVDDLESTWASYQSLIIM